MAGIDLPTKAIRQQVASAIDLVVQLSRMRDGQRKVTSITEITGMEGDTITMQEIFLYESHGISKEGVMTGVFRPTGTSGRTSWTSSSPPVCRSRRNCRGSSPIVAPTNGRPSRTARAAAANRAGRRRIDEACDLYSEAQRSHRRRSWRS